MLVRVLLAVESPALRRRLKRLVQDPNVLVSDGAAAGGLWEGLARETHDLLVVGRATLREPAGDTIRAIRRLPDRPEVVVVQSAGEAEEGADLLSAGCLSVVSESLSDRALGDALAALIRRRREAAMTGLRSDPNLQYRLHDFASSSPAIRPLLDLAIRVAAADSSLLILGETGVGKEWLARAIHAEGRRAAAPFIAVNCAAVPDSLLESELFGHERGSFTGASRSHRGYFELAHRGTIFLDEIGDMSPHLQAKLLRVLQDRRIQRIGAETLIEVDVRLMAATHHDLEEGMATKAFRKDLYYRLATVALTIPPLRERREDIPALAATYLEQFNRQLGRSIAGIRPDALEVLAAYPWPGNVRELINVMERAVLLCGHSEIDLSDLPEALRTDGPASDHAHSTSSLGLSAGEWRERSLREVRSRAIETVERAYLEQQLADTGGRIDETARRSGVTTRALYDKLKRYGLKKEDYRGAARAPSGGARPLEHEAPAH